MFYVANQILKDNFLAEDAVHDSFVKFMENLDKIQDVNCHKTKRFVVIIVRNHAINTYNNRKKSGVFLLRKYNICFLKKTLMIGF